MKTLSLQRIESDGYISKHWNDDMLRNLSQKSQNKVSFVLVVKEIISVFIKYE